MSYQDRTQYKLERKRYNSPTVCFHMQNSALAPAILTHCTIDLSQLGTSVKPLLHRIFRNLWEHELRSHDNSHTTKELFPKASSAKILNILEWIIGGTRTNLSRVSQVIQDWIDFYIESANAMIRPVTAGWRKRQLNISCSHAPFIKCNELS